MYHRVLIWFKWWPVGLTFTILWQGKFVFRLYVHSAGDFVAEKVHGHFWVTEVKIILWTSLKTHKHRLNATRPMINKFHTETPELKGKNVCSNNLSHIASLTAMHIFGKPFTDLLLQNQSINGLWTWYVALGAQVLPRWYWVDFELFLCQDQIYFLVLRMGKC